MRRRRQLLKADTFPFLAVLLCAMGSLILLLLIMDRQAKLAARKKAKASAEEVKRRSTLERAKLIAAREAEWEKKQQAYHSRLAQKDRHLLQQLAEIRKKKQDTDSVIQVNKQALQELQRDLEKEQERIAVLQSQLLEKRKSLANQKKNKHLSNTKLIQVAAEVRQLEKILAELKTLQKRQQQTYSLVPYKGKHGTNHQPIYVECQKDGVIFHPEGKKLKGAWLSTRTFRLQLENRMTKLLLQKDHKIPYLFLLIRPKGIRTYALVLASLAGLDIDFGYELVDQDWVLDFSGNRNFPSSKLPDSIAKLTRLPTLKGAGLNDLPKEILQGLQSGTTKGGEGRGKANIWTPSQGPGLGKAGFLKNKGAGLPGGPNKKGIRTIVDPSLLATKEFSHGPGKEVGRGKPTTSRNKNKPSTKEDGSPQKKGKGLTKPTKDVSAKLGKPTSPNRFTSKNQSPMETKPKGTPDHKGLVTGDLKEIPDNKGLEAGDPNAQQGEENPTPSSPVAKYLGRRGMKPGLPKRKVPFHRMGFNRDWKIEVQCKANGVVIPITGQRYSIPELQAGAVGEIHPLTARMKKLIDRRLGAIISGEIPYRPIFHFRIDPDGLRSYHLVYFLLEPLGHTMTRQDIRPEAPGLKKYYKQYLD